MEIDKALEAKVAAGMREFFDRIVELKAKQVIDKRQDMALRCMKRIEDMQADLRLKAKNIERFQTALDKAMGQGEWDALAKIVDVAEPNLSEQ